MKKIWILIAAAITAVSLTACGTGDISSSSKAASSKAASSQAASSQVSSSPKVEASSVPDDLGGLQTYLTGNAEVTGKPTAMRGDIIGAKAGVRYLYGHSGNNNITLELYEFDTASPNEKAQKTIADAKAGGKIDVLGQSIDGVLSKSGKYLMIYKNTASDDAQKAYDAQVKKLFTEFKAE
jgi:hypothetical protein